MVCRMRCGACLRSVFCLHLMMAFVCVVSVMHVFRKPGCETFTDNAIVAFCVECPRITLAVS